MPEFLRFMNPPTMEKPPGYSHVVEIKGDARIVFFAGQLGVDTSGKFVGAPGDFKAQTMQAFENLKAALEAVGANFGHLVKINNYLVDNRRRTRLAQPSDAGRVAQRPVLLGGLQQRSRRVAEVRDVVLAAGGGEMAMAVDHAGDDG